MARPVDEKIIKFRIDNQDFKDKATETIGIFGRIKEGLNKIPGVNLGKTTSDLGNIKKAASNVGVDDLASNVQTVSDRLSTMGIIGVTALVNITNKAVDAGIKLAKSFTVDPIMDGMTEYEQKMGSIQTILANTDGKKTLEDVSKTLGELNTYSDKTVYSFADMTRNIGMFTAAGVGLEDSATAIKGLSNLAASVGADNSKASMAMYQLSQELALGNLTLMGLKSVENAGMAGPAFRNAIMDAAIAQGKLDKRLSPGEFRETLTKGKWADTEVMIEAFRGFSENQMMEDAATKVKTFSQLMGTVKESIGSGWAETWELVIGDFEQARARFSRINDILSEMVGRSSDARNDFVRSLADTGAFQDLWDGATNILQAINKVMIIVSDTFRSIFPPADVNKIKGVTQAFKNFTESLIPGEKGTKVLKAGLSIIFGIMRVGYDIVTGLGKVFLALIPTNLITTLLKVGGALLELVRYLLPIDTVASGLRTVFDNLATGAENIRKKVEPLIDIFGEKLTKAIKNIIPMIEGFKLNTWPIILENLRIIIGHIGTAIGNIKFPDLTGFMDRIRKMEMPKLDNPFKDFDKDGAMTKASNVFETIGKAIEKVKDFLKSLWDVVKEVGKGMAGAGAGIGELFGNANDKVKNVSLFEVLGVAGIGSAIVIFKRLAGLISAAKDALATPGELVDSIKNFFDTIGNALGEFSKQAKFESLRKVAISVGILAVSLVALSFVPTEDLVKGLASIGAGLGAMVIAMAVMNKLDFKNLESRKLAILMIGMGAALSMLAGTVKKLASIDPDELTTGVTATVVMITALVGALALLQVVGKMSNGSDMDMGKTVITLGALALVVKVLTSSVTRLAKLPTDTLKESTNTVIKLLVVLIGAFVAISAIPLKGLDNIGAFVKFSKALAGSAVAILVFSFAMKGIVEVVEEIGKIDFNVLKQGMLGLAGILLAIGAFQFISQGKGTIQAGIGLAIIAASLRLLVVPLTSLGEMDKSTLAQGLMAISIALAAIGLSILAAKRGFTGAAGILIVIAAMAALHPIIVAYGNMELSSLAIGLLALGGALAILVGAMYLATGALAGAATMVIMVAAINLLIPTILVLSQMDVGQVATMLIALGGALTIIALGGAAVGLVTPLLVPAAVGIVLMSAALVVLGGALAVLGNIPIKVTLVALGLLMAVFATFGAIAVLMAPLAPAMLAVGAGLLVLGLAVGTVGMALSIFGAGLAVFVGSVSVSVSGILLAFSLLLDGIIKIMPKVGDTITAFIQMIAKVIIDNTPAIMLAMSVLLFGFLKTIVDALPRIVALGVTLIVALIEGLTRGLPLIVFAAIDMLIGFIDGMAVAVRVKGPELVDAVLSLVGEMLILLINSFIDILNTFLGWIPGVTEALGHVGEESSNFLREKFGGDRTGRAMVGDLAQGMQDGSSEIQTGAQDIADLTNEKFSKPDFNATGQAITTELGDGMGKGSSGIDMELDNILSGITGGFEGLDLSGGGMGMMDSLGDGLSIGGEGALDISSILGDDIDTNLLGDDLEDPALRKMLGLDKGIKKGSEMPLKSARETNIAIEDTMGSGDFVKQGEKISGDTNKGLQNGKPAIRKTAQELKDEVEGNLKGIDSREHAKNKLDEYNRGMQDGSPKVLQTAEELKNGIDNKLKDSTPKEDGKEKISKYDRGMNDGRPEVINTAENIRRGIDDTLDESDVRRHADEKMARYNQGLKDGRPRVIDTASETKASVDKELASGDTRKIGRTEINDFTEGMYSRKGSVFDSAKTISASGRAGFREVSTFGTGKYFADGVIKGINSKKKEVRDAARGLASTGLYSMNERLSINSPSDETTESGEFFGEGFVRGIIRKTKDTVSAASNMGQKTMDSLNDFINDFSQAFVQDNEMEVLLKPVIDLDSMPTVPDQKVRLTADQLLARELLASTNYRTSQNDDTSEKLLRMLADKKESGDTITYEIHLTANGDLPRSSIKKMATQLQEEIKNLHDRDKMSKGISVSY